MTLFIQTKTKFCNTNLSRYISIAETCALWCMQIRETRGSLGELEISLRARIPTSISRSPKLPLVFP